MPGHPVSLTTRIADDLAETARAIASSLESVFESVDVIKRRLIEVHRDVVTAQLSFKPRHLAKLRPVIVEQLQRRPFADGFGVLTAPDLFVDTTRYLEWWRHDGQDIIPLWLNFDPTSVDIYDYLEMEWFTNAQHHNARTVYGPYVDSCSDHYVLTMTSPVVHGSFLGVVGGDVRMSLFEAELLPVLDHLVKETVLVNTDRRVVLANSPRWTVGSRLSEMPGVSDNVFAAVVDVGADSKWVLAAMN